MTVASNADKGLNTGYTVETIKDFLPIKSSRQVCRTKLSVSMGLKQLLHSFEDSCDTLASTNTHGDQSIGAPGAAEFIQRLDH